jgi:hypothetical protein
MNRLKPVQASLHQRGEREGEERIEWRRARLGGEERKERRESRGERE